MSTPLTIEEESGTTTGTRHPHNGYYAGDFSGRLIQGVTRTHGASLSDQGPTSSQPRRGGASCRS